MRGMKKASEEFKMNNIRQVTNDVQAPITVVTNYSKRQKKLRKTSRVSAKGIVSLLMIFLGIAAIIFSFMEAYFMDNHKYYSQYVFMNLDEVAIVLACGLASLFCGLKLAEIP